VTIDKVFNLDLVTAFKHAVNLVIIDGLCLGIDVSGDRQKAEILKMCDQFLLNIDEQVFGVEPSRIDYDRLPYISTQTHLGVQPFQISKLGSQIETSYAFDARTTKVNLLKLLRAYELNKPILIEGPPGVGKTSLVEHLAKVTGRKLIRVNLSEQTDMMDLLGSEYPVQHHNRDHKNPSNAASDKDEDDIRFHWCDGVLLQAIKEGHWFLIDEMNLAQQSVLEGLNAILDHRRTVYIPELNHEFKCHPNFFVFACQNPS
jgi:midasin